MLLIQIINLNPTLKPIDTAPNETLLILRNSQTVMRTTFDTRDIVATKRRDLRRSHDDSILVASSLRDARLAIVIQSPSEDSPARVNAKRMVRAACDGLEFRAAHGQWSWNEAIQARAFDDAAAELVLLAGTPSEDGAVGVKGECVVGACGYVGDFLQLGD
jgi:hypothetical protein